MAEIVPALLVEDFGNLREELSKVIDTVNVVQIDVCDGIFTPKATWPYNNKSETNFEKLLTEQEGLPFWDRLDFEIDLMVSNPKEEAEKWVRVGAKRIILHYESLDVEDMFGLINELKSLYVEVVIALDIDTPVDVLESIIELIDGVQLMGIQNVGFQHQPFDQEVISKIYEIKEQFPDLLVSIDGGVNQDTAPALVDAGADELVVGSAIFGNSDIVGTIEDLKAL